MKLLLDHNQHRGGALYIEMMKEVSCSWTCDDVRYQDECERLRSNQQLRRPTAALGFDC